MSYLTSDDLKGFLDEREITAIKRDYETDHVDKMSAGIQYAENYVSDRLSHRFDMPAEYAKTGGQRSTTLLEIIAHIAIWKLAATFPTVQLDGKRHYFYEQALTDLDKIATGKLSTTLPVLSTTAGGPVVYGSSIDTDINY
jgi:hypothetical protein